MVAKVNAQYDAHAKKLLSKKIILGRILKNTVAELKDYSLDEVMSFIGDIEISKVPVDSGETNQPSLEQNLSMAIIRI